MQAYGILMILKLSLITHILRMVFIKILKNTIWIRNIKILTVFHNMIADMLSNKKLNPVVTELFIRGKKLNISLVFITQFYFAVPKNIRLNSTHYFIIKIPIKQELLQIAFNHSSDIDFKDFMNLHKKCTAKPYFFLVIDATLAWDNSSLFRKSILEIK